MLQIEGPARGRKKKEEEARKEAIRRYELIQIRQAYRSNVMAKGFGSPVTHGLSIANSFLADLFMRYRGVLF